MSLVFMDSIYLTGFTLLDHGLVSRSIGLMLLFSTLHVDP